MNSSVTFELGVLDILIILGVMWFLYHLADIGKDLFWDWWDIRLEKQAQRLKENTAPKQERFIPKSRVNLPPRNAEPQAGPLGQRPFNTQEYKGRHATDPNLTKVDPEPPAMTPPAYMQDVEVVIPDLSSHQQQLPTELVEPWPDSPEQTIHDAVVIEDEEDPLLRSRAERVQYKYYTNGKTVHRRDCGVVRAKIDNNELDPFLWADNEREVVDYASTQELHLCGTCRPGEVKAHA